MPIGPTVFVFQATSVRGRTYWSMAVVMSMCPIQSCTAARAAFPTAAAACTSVACPVACSPVRCGDSLLLFGCSQVPVWLKVLVCEELFP